MDSVGLPLLKRDDTLEQAIIEMNALDRHEVVLDEGGGHYRILTNVEVLAGWRVGKATLGNLGGGQQVAALTGFANAVVLARAPVGDAVKAASETMDGTGSLFGVVGGTAPGRWIHVVTRHEGVAAQSRTRVKSCVCEADSAHNGDAPPKDATATTCPSCPGAWRCA